MHLNVVCGMLSLGNFDCTFLPGRSLHFNYVRLLCIVLECMYIVKDSWLLVNK